MMKKILLMAVVAMMATMNVNAQSDEPKNEVGIFYGIGSASDIISTYAEVFSYAVGGQSSFWGPIGAEYYYHISPVVGVGAIAEYTSCKVDALNQNEACDLTYITVMPAVKFNWLRKKSFGMYSGLAAGVMFASIDPGSSVKGQLDSDGKEIKKETATSFMFNATALGVEFGGNFRGFGELGIGEKGILCFGLRYKF
ncbi:MAG: hypothetical protein IKN15_07985 [Bacteroidaceae bacterium]|nr:hypothetical protein [Bacteroidaceae bacterium]